MSCDFCTAKKVLTQHPYSSGTVADAYNRDQLGFIVRFGRGNFAAFDFKYCPLCGDSFPRPSKNISTHEGISRTS